MPDLLAGTGTYLNTARSVMGWHLDNHWLPSANYHYGGGAVIWWVFRYSIPSLFCVRTLRYLSPFCSLSRLSIPSRYATSFRLDVEALESSYEETSSSPSELCSRSLMHGDKIIEPSWLAQLGYPQVTMLVQEPGDWVFTHPCCPNMTIVRHACLRESTAVAIPSMAELMVRASDCTAKLVSLPLSFPILHPLLLLIPSVLIVPRPAPYCRASPSCAWRSTISTAAGC
jgi:hypothetical protein